MRQAQKVVTLYPVPYIKESLAIIKIKIAQKIVKNIPAYTITVLKNDYTLLQHIPKKPVLKEVNKNHAKNVNVLVCDENHTALSYSEKEAQRYFNTLIEEEQKSLILQFEKEKITSDILKTLYKKE